VLATLDPRVTGLGLWRILGFSNQNHEAAIELAAEHGQGPVRPGG
jgi:hypothetical protein